MAHKDTTNRNVNRGHTGRNLSIGLTVAAAALAGAYFLYGKNGPKNRKKIKGWTLRAKGEILEKLENLKDINEEAYHKVVDTVSAKYGGLKNVDRDELSAMVKEVKGHWQNIKKQLAEGERKASKSKK